MIYEMEPGINQTVVMKINEGLSFPDEIRIKKAVLYRFNSVPRTKIWKDGTGRISKAWTFPDWLKIYDEEGNCGEGPVMPDAVNIYLPMMLEEDAPHTNVEWRRLFYWRVRGVPSSFRALQQLEMVIFDLLAKKRGVPVHRLLGASKDYTDCYRGGGTVLQDDDRLIEELLEIKNAGYKATKFKISFGDYKDDVRRMRKVREALGDDFGIAVDSNQAWDAETCMKFLREVKDLNIRWYEEPVDAFDMDEIRKLKSLMQEEQINVPVAMGESAYVFDTFRSYVNAGVDIAQPLSNFYSLAEQMRTINFCRDHGLKITSGQNDLPGVVIGALLQDGEPIEFHRPNTEGMEDYFTVKAKLHEDGKLYLPDVPGLPVRVDFSRLDEDRLFKEAKYFYHK